MVALLGQLARSASPSPTTTVSTHCQLPKDSPASYPTPQQPETHDFYSPAVLRDIPTDVPTTADATDAGDDDDDDRCRCHLSTSADIISTTDQTFLQAWDAFYTDFLHFAHSFDVSTPNTNEEPHDSVTAASNAANNDPPAIDDPDSLHTFLSELDALHRELSLHLPPPNASNPHTPATDDSDTNDRNIASANIDCDNNECDNNDQDKADSSKAANDKDNPTAANPEQHQAFRHLESASDSTGVLPTTTRVSDIGRSANA